MKKLILSALSLIFIISAAFVVTGCSKKDKVATTRKGSRNDNCVMLSASETSPGKAKPSDLMLP